MPAKKQRPRAFDAKSPTQKGTNFKLINEKELEEANLETLKGELHSLKEELRIVSNQLLEKAWDLRKAHEDMTNLVVNTDIAAIFLDTNMCIQRFTPSAGQLLFGLIATDTGRPVSSCASPLTGEDLINDARQVLDKLMPITKEIWMPYSIDTPLKSKPSKTRAQSDLATELRAHVVDESRCYLRRVGPFRAADNRIEGVVVTFVDVTERKQAEVNMRNIERLRRMVESLPAGVVFIENKRIQLNLAAELITGYARDELQTRDQWFATLFGDHGEKIFEKYQKHRQSGFHGIATYTITRKDGQHRTLDFFQRRFDGQEIWLFHDVTDRQIAKEELKLSEQRLHTIVETAGDAIITINDQGIIQTFNTAAERMFGYKRREVVGKNVSILMPTPYREEHDIYIKKYLETGEAKIIGLGREVEAQRKDGSILPIELTVSEIENHNLFTGIIRDLTERKNSENELRKSHDALRDLSNYLQAAIEDEKKSVAREIHDELGQALTSVKVDLFSLKRILWDKNQTVAVEKTDSIVKRVDDTLEGVNRIISGLRPKVLDDLGLIAALEWYIKEYRERTDIEVDLVVNMEESRLPKRVFLPLFRIVQELLTNVFRHANATHVDLVFMEKNDQGILKVVDNGIGIDKKAILSLKSFGLIGIRERLRLMGGTMSISGKPNKGTVVTVRVPI